MNVEQQALKSFLDSVDTKVHPMFNPWGRDRAYFTVHGIDVLNDMVVDPTRYPFDLGYRWGVLKIIRASQQGRYFDLLSAAFAATL